MTSTPQSAADNPPSNENETPGHPAADDARSRPAENVAQAIISRADTAVSRLDELFRNGLDKITRAFSRSSGYKHAPEVGDDDAAQCRSLWR